MDRRRDAVARGLRGQLLERSLARHAQRLRPNAGGRSRTLKNLFQERGIAPHLRHRLPALHAGQRLLYVAGIGMDRSEAPAAANEPRVEIDWRADDVDDPRAAFCEAGPPV